MVNSNPAYKTDAIQEPEVVDKLLCCFAKDDDLPVLHNKLHEYYGIVFNRKNLLHRLRQP